MKHLKTLIPYIICAILVGFIMASYAEAGALWEHRHVIFLGLLL